MPRRVIGNVVAAAALLAATPVCAQSTDFHRLRARIGDQLYVTDPERRVEISGRLTSLSDDELTIDGYRFGPKAGLKVERAATPSGTAPRSDSCSVASRASRSAWKGV